MSALQAKDGKMVAAVIGRQLVVPARMAEGVETLAGIEADRRGWRKVSLVDDPAGARRVLVSVLRAYGPGADAPR